MQSVFKKISDKGNKYVKEKDIELKVRYFDETIGLDT